MGLPIKPFCLWFFDEKSHKKFYGFTQNPWCISSGISESFIAREVKEKQIYFVFLAFSSPLGEKTRGNIAAVTANFEQ